MVAVAFAVVLVVPAVLFAIGLRPPDIENRPLLTPPQLSLGGLLDPSWYGALDRFLTDNLLFRAPAVRIVGVVENELLGGTTNTQVIRGTGDWLFASVEMRPTCERSASQVLKQVDAVAGALAASDRTFRFLPIPDKHAVYPEAVRADSPLPTPCTDLRRPAMQAGVDARPKVAIDGWRLMRDLRASGSEQTPLYFRADSHWTPTALMVEVHALVDSLQPGVWQESDVRPGPPLERDQELSRLLGLSKVEVVADVRVRPAMKVVERDVPLKEHTHAARAVFEFRSTGLEPVVEGRTLIVYDSFFGNYIRHLAPFFRDSVWVHVDDLAANPALATELGRIDTVIFERVERELYRSNVSALFGPLTK